MSSPRSLLRQHSKSIPLTPGPAQRMMVEVEVGRKEHSSRVVKRQKPFCFCILILQKYRIYFNTPLSISQQLERAVFETIGKYLIWTVYYMVSFVGWDNSLMVTL